MNAWNLDAVALGSFNAREILGLAWLCEQAARSCAFDGKIQWSEQLRSDAAKLRATAMLQLADGGAA